MLYLICKAVLKTVTAGLAIFLHRVTVKVKYFHRYNTKNEPVKTVTKHRTFAVVQRRSNATVRGGTGGGVDRKYS